MTPPDSKVRVRLGRIGITLLSLIAVVSLIAVAAFVATSLTAHSERTPSELISASSASHQAFPTWQPQGQTVHLVSTLDAHLTGATNTAESTNWAGYADTGPTFSAISAQWVVPTVQPSQASQYSATWIGLDGANNSSLIQTGTAQETSGGATTYYEWYEILPAYAFEIASVTPGDQMQASISEIVSGTWMIAISDLTSGNVFSQDFAYSGPGSSAEWIEEAPTVNGQQSTLADFGTARFTSISETDSGSTAVSQTPIYMINSGGGVIASPGAIANSAFTVTYDGPVPPSAASTATTISTSPSSTTYGNAVTYSASVTSASGTPSGSVTFTIGTNVLCTGILTGGAASCSATSAPEGTDMVVGSYGGASSFTTSSGSATLEVSAPTPTSTTTTTTSPTTTTTTTTPTPTATATSTHGYWLVGSDGGIFSFGSAQFYGSTGDLTLQRPVVGISPTANDAGYWLVASDGGIFSFGKAAFYGSIPGLGIAPAGSASPRRLNAPIVAMVPTTDGGGYFMVGADGGVFTFGDATFEGSCPGIGGCSGAAVAVVPDTSGKGYWLVTATGHVYPFGDAVYHGQPGPQSAPVTSATRTTDGGGYWILFSNGVVDAYGDAANLGGPVGSVDGVDPATTIFTTSDGGGYWVSSADGSVFTQGDAPYEGGMSAVHLNGSIIAATGW